MNESESPDTRARYWRAQIAAWPASGQSQLAFCRANELNYPRFRYWLGKFRRQGQVSESGRASSFVPVVAAPGDGSLSVHLPNGIELRGVNAQNLHVVEQLLARL